MSELETSPRVEDFRPSADLAGLGSRALVLGAVGGVATVAGAFLDREHFFYAYLVGWLFWFSVAAGCLGLLLLQHLSGGKWGLALRRPMEAAARTMPVIGVLAVPLLLGLDRLFVWTDHARVEADHLLHHKAGYLNVPFFVGRTVFVIALFTLLARVLSKKSAEQDRGAGAGATWSMQKVSSIGLLVFVLAITFLGFDWLMSLDPYWFSSLFGAIFLAGCGIAGLTFLILIANWLAKREPMRAVYSKKRFHDFGTLLFAFVMFFTYLGISQFIIAYQGNLPEEVVWFQERFHAHWGWVAVGLLIFHFFFPFLILLSRAIKRRAGTLAAIAAFVLVMRWVDLIWHTRPSLAHEGFGLTWIDLAAPVGVGGIWLFFFARQLASRPLLAVGDPKVAEVLGHE